MAPLAHDGTNGKASINDPAEVVAMLKKNANSESSDDVLSNATQKPLAGTFHTSEPRKRFPGLSFQRFFTKAGVSPYDEVQWELRTAAITDAQGGVIFEQKDVEVPKDWSMTATNIVASKYLHGQIGRAHV